MYYLRSSSNYIRITALHLYKYEVVGAQRAKVTPICISFLFFARNRNDDKLSSTSLYCIRITQLCKRSSRAKIKTPQFIYIDFTNTNNKLQIQTKKALLQEKFPTMQPTMDRCRFRITNGARNHVSSISSRVCVRGGVSTATRGI